MACLRYPSVCARFGGASSYMRFLTVVLLASAVLAVGCKDGATTTPTKTPADPTTTETFAGTLKVGGYAFYSFPVSKYGTVNVTLNSLRVDGELSDAAMLLSIGSPQGLDCIAASTQTAAAGLTPQVTGSFEPGIYCARIGDTVPLPSPGSFNITIAYP